MYVVEDLELEPKDHAILLAKTIAEVFVVMLDGDRMSMVIPVLACYANKKFLKRGEGVV